MVQQEYCMFQSPMKDRRFLWDLNFDSCFQTIYQCPHVCGHVLHGFFTKAIALRVIRRRVPGNCVGVPHRLDLILDCHNSRLPICLQYYIASSKLLNVLHELFHQQFVTRPFALDVVSQHHASGLVFAADDLLLSAALLSHVLIIHGNNT